MSSFYFCLNMLNVRCLYTFLFFRAWLSTRFIWKCFVVINKIWTLFCFSFFQHVVRVRSRYGEKAPRGVGTVCIHCFPVLTLPPTHFHPYPAFYHVKIFVHRCSKEKITKTDYFETILARVPTNILKPIFANNKLCERIMMRCLWSSDRLDKLTVQVRDKNESTRTKNCFFFRNKTQRRY